jgi:hypothetical protein
MVMRQPLVMNLAKRPFTNDIPLWIGVGLLLACVLGLSLWNGGNWLATGSQVKEMSARRLDLDQQKRKAGQREQVLIRDIEASRSELLNSRATFANTIIQSHSFSWTRLFNELEMVMPLGVRLVNIRPRIEDGIRLRMNGVARNSQAFWEFQDNLDEWPVFGNVYPDGVAPSAARSGIMAGELIVSLETEYFPEARLRLNLPETGPALVDAQPDAISPVAATPEATGSLTPSLSPAPTGAESGEIDGTAAAAKAEPSAEQPSMVRRRKGGRRGQAQRPARPGGVERITPSREGAPGLEKPDVNTAPRPAVEGFQRPDVHSVGEDGRMLDADGSEITIEDLINLPNGIKRGPADEDIVEPGTRNDGRPQGNEVKGSDQNDQPPADDGGSRNDEREREQ